MGEPRRRLHTLTRGALTRGALIACLLTSCSTSPKAPSSAQTYVPGFGEIMSFQQMRHIKLWFAGQAQNWPLASYEVDELGEGFDDVVTYHPTLGKKPVAPKDLVPKLVREPLDSLGAAVDRRDLPAFDAAYDALTAGGNSCHQAMDFAFNRVQRPTSNPYANQVFTPAQ